MTKWFWRIYLPLAFLFFSGILFVSLGSTIESRLAPIRVNNVIHDIERTPTSLCFWWRSDKLRLAQSDNVDVFLDRADINDRSFPEIYNKLTGKTWHRNGVRPVGHDDMPFCINLTRQNPDVSLTEPLVLHLVIHYHGWKNLWDLPVPLPDVVSNPSPRR